MSVLKRWLGLKPSHEGNGPLAPRARFDAAKTGIENRNHWSQADSLSPNGAASPDVRRILRERARYEVANNSFAFGTVGTLANDLVGTGPRLSLMGLSDEAATAIEASFQAWADETSFAETLRCLHRACVVDGESFAAIATDDTLAHPVKLRLRSFEADRVTDPSFFTVGVGLGYVDGIAFDSRGNPSRYRVLREHPGDLLGWRRTTSTNCRLRR